MKASLDRRIGLFALVLYGVGDILGAGVYGLVGKAAGQMGNGVWLAFLASMVAAGLTGLSYASLGSRYPRAGGASFVVHRAYGQGWLAYLVGLAVLASGLTSMATATRVFSGYFQGLVSDVLPFPLIVVGFALFLAWVVIRGIRESLWMNSLCTVIELSGLVLIIVCGLRFVGQVDLMSFQTSQNPGGALSFPLVLSGAVLTFFSFVGFEDILNVGEEVVDPERTLPIGLLLAVAISSIIYILVSVVAVSAVPAPLLAESKQPLVDVARVAAPWFPSGLFSVVALFAVSNTALLNFVMGSRLVYGMAGQRLLPAFLGRVHPKRRTPHVSALVLLGFLLILALLGDISSLAKATSVLLLFCFVLVNLALILLKLKKDEPSGKFEVPIFVPFFGSLVCGALLGNAKTPELITAGLILSGIIVLYFVMRPKDSDLEKMDSL